MPLIKLKGTISMALNFFCCYSLLLLLSVVLGNEIAPSFYGLDRPSLDYELPPLRFGFDELEPYIDEASIRMHYFDFHKTYVEETNSLLKRWRRHSSKGKHVSRMSIVEILRNISHIPAKFRSSLKNSGSGMTTFVRIGFSGFVNHNLYWAVISPNPQGDVRIPQNSLGSEITSQFGSFLEFKATFTDMALNIFGSGYVWLCLNCSSTEKAVELVITITRNEESPISEGLCPILGLDIWEHAYVLNMRNQREKYIENWWFVVDWQHVAELADWWNKLKFHDEL